MEFHLAPLENISCWAFRSLYTGATDSYTGMLSLTNLVQRNNTWDEVDTFEIKGQRQWIQIATSKETECYSFLIKLEEELKKNPKKDNIYGIQLNCSCPSPDLINIGQGPALIKRATKIGKIIRELLKSKYKVGIKVRLGLNRHEVQQRKIVTLFKELELIALENPNFTNVTVHFKHAQESSSTPYDYSFLNELASFQVPLIINGGIKNDSDIKKLIEIISPENRKNVKGVMIGREAMKNTDCFLELIRDFDGTTFVSRDNEDIRTLFKDFCTLHKPKLVYMNTIKERIELLA